LRLVSILVLLFISLNGPASASSAHNNDSISYTLFLIGDVGDDTLLSSPVLTLLKSQLKEANDVTSAVIFLGDNIYPEGLHKKKHENRTEDETRLNAQLDILVDFKGDIVFLAGNHDWEKDGQKGDNFVRRQEKYIEDYLKKGNIFLPDNACPGPEVVELNDNLVLIIIDTQWWLHKYDKPRGEQDDCVVLDKGGLISQFSDLLKKYKNKNVFIAAHHPLYSNGVHGGKFPVKDHIFPLTAINKSLYLPLPVIGSIYPLYRQMLGNRQDIAHPDYQQMKILLTDELNEYENIIYAAGHEHSLQYKKEGSNHYIISGSGSKSTYVRDNNEIEFGKSIRGFSRVTYYKNGSVYVDFISPDSSNSSVLFHKLLYSKEPIKSLPHQINKPTYLGRNAQVVPDNRYIATKMKRRFFGDLNRDVWTTEIEVPYLDINYSNGGLSPIKKGGGMQTRSLRMMGGNGHQYVLRMIKKDATYLVDKDLRNTLAQDLVLDGIAGSHPYASIVIPKFADAVGVYHTNPKLVYVPADSSLGIYREEFGGSFCLYEERPDDDMSEFTSFGNTKKVVSTSKTLRKIHDKHNDVVDINYTIRARLLDMIIGDWDRHDDQWRWATFKTNDKTYYRPIPRDRDQAFFMFDGLFPKITNRKWALKKFQSLEPEIRDISGLNCNARYFDRTFLTGADLDTWLAVADSVENEFTDIVIETAIDEFPKEALEINREYLISTLKYRRDNLSKTTKEYYRILSKEVDVVGTTGNDYFEIKRISSDTVVVKIFARKGNKKQKGSKYYERSFNKSETKEIRIYGLGGNDEYKITGEVDNSILVRVIGGFDKDNYKDQSVVSGWRKHTIIYDVRDENDEFETTSETKLKLSKEEDAYSYNRKEFKYGKLIPIPSIGSTPDDGLFLGGGFRLVNHGFKKDPYKSNHNFMANVAFKTGAFRIRYLFDYTELFGRWNFSGIINIDQPLTYDFYGFGNETSEPIDEDEPTIRQKNIRINPFLRHVSKNFSHNLLFGVIAQFVEFDQSDQVNQKFPTLLNKREIGGLNVIYSFANMDDKVNPNRGIDFRISAEWNHSMTDESVDFQRVKPSLSLYLPIRFSPVKTTLAIRSGGAFNTGDYEFYQSNFLGGYKEFRGVGRNRFAGKNSYYNNFDLRLNVFSVPNYILPIDIGLMGHFDVARVWEPDENSKLWHSSYGMGIFVNILDFIILNTTYSISDVDEAFVIRTNFLF